MNWIITVMGKIKYSFNTLKNNYLKSCKRSEYVYHDETWYISCAPLLLVLWGPLVPFPHQCLCQKLNPPSAPLFLIVLPLYYHLLPRPPTKQQAEELSLCLSLCQRDFWGSSLMPLSLILTISKVAFGLLRLEEASTCPHRPATLSTPMMNSSENSRKPIVFGGRDVLFASISLYVCNDFSTYLLFL